MGSESGSGTPNVRSVSRSISGSPLRTGKSNGHARSRSFTRSRSRSTHTRSVTHSRSVSDSPMQNFELDVSLSPHPPPASSRRRTNSREERRPRRSRTPEERVRRKSRSHELRMRRRSRSLSSPRRRSRSPRRSRSRRPSRTPRRFSRSPRRGIPRYSPIRRSRYNDGRDNPEPCACLGVFGMSLNTTERDLKRIFGEFGEIETVQLVYDRYSGRSRGFGFVYFESTKSAIRAKEHLRDAVIDGMRVRVDFSVTKGAPTYHGRGSRRSRSRTFESPHRRRSRS